MKVTHTWRADGDRIVDERWICDDHNLDLICPADFTTDPNPGNETPPQYAHRVIDNYLKAELGKAVGKLEAIEQTARKHDMADIIAILDGPPYMASYGRWDESDNPERLTDHDR